MSKKKSMAWDRKTRGHISKGVFNYKSVEMLGRLPSRPSRRSWAKRRAKREAVGQLDAVRQVNEAHIDFGLVRMFLEQGMSLTDAKLNACAYQVAVGEFL